MSICQSNPFMTNHDNSHLKGVYRRQNGHNILIRPWPVRTG